MTTPLRIALLALVLGLSGCPAPRVPKDAVLLYDVDFADPGQVIGDAVVTREPSTNPYPARVPTRVFFGHPRVVPELCGLKKQPLVLTTSSAPPDQQEGIELALLGELYAQYHIELDVCVEQMRPLPSGTDDAQFLIFLDVPEAHSIGFTNSGAVMLWDPSVVRDNTLPHALGNYERDKPVHIAIDFDIQKQTLRIAIDGKTAYDAPAKTLLPRSLRLLVRGNPMNIVGADNVLIWAKNLIPEPSPEELEKEFEPESRAPAPGSDH